MPLVSQGTKGERMTEDNSGSLPPAGWFPDGSGELRWWDGERWTEHTRALSDANALGSDAGQAEKPATRWWKSKSKDAAEQHMRNTAGETIPAEWTGSGSKDKAATKNSSPVEAWSHLTQDLDVVGESHYSNSFNKIFKGESIGQPDGVELFKPATLVRDAKNAHDSNAVAVYIDGLQVGFLERERAAEFRPALDALESGAHCLQVASRQWARQDKGEKIFASASVKVPPVGGIRPANSFPQAPYVVLPAGSAMQVGREDEHMNVLSPFLSSTSECWLAVVLRLAEEVRARSTATFIEIVVDDEVVGILTSASSEKLCALVKHVNDRGSLAVARARLRGNGLQAEIAIYCAKSTEVSNEWIASVQPA